MHNHTDNDIEIDVDSPFVTLVFSYLGIPSSIKEDNPPSRTDILQRFGIELSREENENLHETPEYKDFDQVCLKMKERREYKTLKSNKFEAFKSLFSCINIILTLMGIVLIVGTRVLYGYSNLTELYECVKYITIAYIPSVFIHIITKNRTGQS